MEHGEIEKQRLAREDWADLVAKGWVKPADVPKHGEADKKAKKRTKRLLRHANKARVREELESQD